MDRITGMRAGDILNVGTTTVSINGNTVTPGTYATAGAAADGVLVSTVAAAVNDASTAVLVQNGITLIRGTFTSAANTFVGSTTGTDTMLVLDTQTVVATAAYEAIVLVGYVNAGTLAIGAGGVITL
jgi:hypothetical protein